MLIGQVFYYSAKSGQRLKEMDSDVTAEYARRASKDGKEIVEWSCRNGDPSDVRYFRDGREIKVSDLPEAMREKEEAYGLTFAAWLRAAGRSDSASEYDLRAAWRAGESPTEYRR